jgi:hypothetical protein
MLHSRNLGRLVIVLGLAGFLVGFEVPAEEPRPAPKNNAPADNPFLAQLLARFDAWDTNKDGFLDKEELTRALGAARANAALEKYGKDGKISKEDYTAWARDYVQQTIKAQQDFIKVQQALPREGAPRPRGRG